MTTLEDSPAVEEAPKTRARQGKYLTFMLREESYGLAVLKVREIIRMQEITPVPKMPNYLKGIINLRGKIISVLDLRIKFALPNQDLTDTACIIVVQTTTKRGISSQMGIIVDAVEEVANISAEDLEDAPEFGSAIHSGYIYGIAKVKGVVKTLLDIDSILDSDHFEEQNAYLEL
ncbi:MAG: chemotaxis protein CheW [Verrucomicrobiota bacterium]